VNARFTPPALGWPAIRAANQDLNITAETHACEWDGTPVDYVEAIDVLVRADQLARGFRGNEPAADSAPPTPRAHVVAEMFVYNALPRDGCVVLRASLSGP
jgi:hypothetical protein